MPSFIKFDNGLSLVEQQVKIKKQVSVKSAVNHIWIYDRSGSMCGDLSSLCKQLISLSKKIPKGDTFTLGWFSSKGDFNWILKGFKITDNTDYKFIEEAINKNSTTKNLTCFSEILADTKTVIDDLSVFSKVFSFSFFTDGYPVVNDYALEIKEIFEAIKNIKGKISSAMLIGYGSYYNKELMMQMSEKLGAILIHSSEVNEYSQNIVKLVKLSETCEEKQEIEPLFDNSDCISVFSVSEQGAIPLSIEEGKIYVSPEKNKPVNIYYLTKNEPNKKSWEKININELDFSSENSMVKAIYSSVLILCQQMKTNIAMEIMGVVGDKSIIDKLNNAFLVEEFGETENFISKAINDVSFRFCNGKDTSYLPKADAFCVYDALTILSNDGEAAFFPYHKDFNYEKTGVKSSEKDGYSKFEVDKTSKCPFSSLVWNESRLNLSVLTSIKGSIKLREIEGVKPKDAGLEENFSTFVYRNYMFINDGHTHIKKFYVCSSENTYKVFKNEGIVVDDDFKKSKTYAINLSSLPCINRSIIGDKIYAEDLCKNVLAEQRLKGEIKALKWLKDDVLEKIEGNEEKISTFSDFQNKFLKDNGINTDKGGSYAPPSEKSEPVDWYMAKTFDIKLKGIATLPTVKNVIEKIASGKTRTPAECLIESGINLWKTADIQFNFEKRSSNSTMHNANLIIGIKEWFDKVLGEKQTSLKEIRSKIQKTKMAVILGKKWFEEFKSREENELVVEGIKCVFELGEQKVGY